MLVHNARLAEKECGIPRKNIFVCDAGDIIEIDIERQAKKAGRIHVGGVMYDDTGAIVSEVVLKDRIHMSQERNVCCGADRTAWHRTIID
ncbi:hypothetical protein [Candidatus Minimicrobia vallesae]|uniref:hypothetical protein n=1 Tax=Candidatus Minimicrobia vallesae TaxID=2841264 RepID=UPI001E539080|nr:hypothetical protein [Candidatus Minimicrobia vallesae]